VAYRETITQEVEAEGKFVRQSGGRGQFGHVWIRLTPQEPGTGFIFEDGIVGGVVPKEFIKPTGQGIEEALQRGIIYGFPMIDVKCTLFDGSYHDVDSSEMSFKIAGSMAVQAGAKKAKAVMLEPVMKLEVTTPEDFMGDVVGDINKRRGRILGITQRGKPGRGQAQIINAYVPLGELFGYVTDLRSMSKGRASSSMTMDHMEPVPDAVAQTLTAKAK
jgi:elongation factor G